VDPNGVLSWDDEPAPVIGLHRLIRPRVRQFSLEPGATLVAFTDGVHNAGRGRAFSGVEALAGLLEESWAEGAQRMAQAALDAALAADKGRPADDMTVVVLKVEPAGAEGHTREMSVRYPLPAYLHG
jgi:serine phosphatase RsbU (regulator of sigma subunit)